MKTMRPAVFLLAALTLVVVYTPALQGMFEQWSNDEDMSHGFVLPIVVLWLVWREREHRRLLPVEPSFWGFAILAAGTVLQLAGGLGACLFSASVGCLV